MPRNFLRSLCASIALSWLAHMHASCATGQENTTPALIRGKAYELIDAGSKKLPDPVIDGQKPRIHTQGIYVSQHSLYVTGRMEREPKQALFLRFERADLILKEVLNLTPISNEDPSEKLHRDHPGGFDYDGQCFWIPVAVSSRHSSTAMIQVCTTLDTDLNSASSEVSFMVDDHIGAIAFDRDKKILYGANWDTEIVYLWNRDGKLLNRLPRSEFLGGDSECALAVQDWKGLPTGGLVAGGIDKRPQGDPLQSRAVIQWVDLAGSQTPEFLRLPDSTAERHHATREGMAFFDQQLFLLPGDLGDSAILFRYRVKPLGK